MCLGTEVGSRLVLLRDIVGNMLLHVDNSVLWWHSSSAGLFHLCLCTEVDSRLLLLQDIAVNMWPHADNIVLW